MPDPFCFLILLSKSEKKKGGHSLWNRVVHNFTELPGQFFF